MSCNGANDVPPSPNNQAAKPCCSPAADGPRTAKTETIAARSSLNPAGRMVLLDGGSFLMGSDYAEAFVQDGEGPVREVQLKPFWMDRTSVTNALFEQFVRETSYTTEAEKYDWSFVFYAHIPRDRFNDLVVDTVYAAPWWCKVPGANWRTPEGPGSSIEARSEHPVVHVSWNDATRY